MAIISADVERPTTQHVLKKDLLDGVSTALALQNKASQQHVAGDTNDGENILADNAAIDTEFRKFREDMGAKIDAILASLNDEEKCFKAFDNVVVKLLVSERTPKPQL